MMLYPVYEWERYVVNILGKWLLWKGSYAAAYGWLRIGSSARNVHKSYPGIWHTLYDWSCYGCKGSATTNILKIGLIKTWIRGNQRKG